MLSDDFLDAVLAVSKKTPPRAGIGGAVNARPTTAKKPPRKKPPGKRAGIGGAVAVRAKSDELERERLRAAAEARLKRIVAGKGPSVRSIAEGVYRATPLGMTAGVVERAVRDPSLENIARAVGAAGTGGMSEMGTIPLAQSIRNVGTGNAGWGDAIMLGSLLPFGKGARGVLKGLEEALPATRIKPRGVPLTAREKLFAKVVANPDDYVFHGTPTTDTAISIEKYGLDTGTVAGDWRHTIDYSQGGYIAVFRKSDFGPDFAPKGQKPVAVYTARDFTDTIPGTGKRSQELGDNPEAYEPWTKPSVRNYLGSDFGPMAEKAARQATPETAEVVGAMKKGRVAAKEQRKIYSEERGKRVGEAQQALAEAGGGLAGRKAALAKLKGELPQVRFDALTHLDDEAMDKLTRIVQGHSDLGFWEQRGVEGALVRMRQGMAPRPFEIKLIEKAFGAEKALEAAGGKSLGQMMRTAVGEVANAPRSLMTFLDVSYLLRQAILAAAAQPKIWARGVGPSVHMLFSEKYYQERMLALANRRSFGDMMDSGVQLTELGSVAQREEQFSSNVIEKLTGGKYSPVRGSGRGYTGFLNETRADLFDYYVGIAKAEGIDSPERRKNIAKMVNMFTGRGTLISKIEPAAEVLNYTLFSPRLFASRVNAISPVFYYKLDPWTRRQALKGVIRLIGAGTTTMTLAALAGAKVGLDPRSSDFGKIRFGNTRFDVWAGHQQLVRVISQAASGETVSPVTGEKTSLTGNYFASRRDPITRFFEGKLAPTPSLVNDWARGKDFLGRPFSWKRALVDRSYPILIQDVLDVQREEGEWWKSIGAYGIGATGISVQTFGPRKPEPKPSRSRIGSRPTPPRGGDSIYRTGGGGSDSIYRP